MSKEGFKNERKVAKRYSGKVKPGSGSKWYSKEDVYTNQELFETKGLLIQNKYSDKKSMSIKMEDMKKLEENALKEDRLPVFRSELKGHGYITIPEWVFECFMELANGK